MVLSADSLLSLASRLAHIAVRKFRLASQESNILKESFSSWVDLLKTYDRAKVVQLPCSSHSLEQLPCFDPSFLDSSPLHCTEPRKNCSMAR